jgi:hypothetical protein
MVNSYYFATGGKEFEAKTDLPFVGSYIGAAPNVDSREFSSIEKQVEKIRRNVNEFKKNDPDFYYDQYLERHPDNPGFVAMYDKSIGRLNKLRQQATAIQGSQDYDPKEKKELIKDNREQQNYLKHMLVEMYKEEGIKP